MRTCPSSPCSCSSTRSWAQWSAWNAASCRIAEQEFHLAAKSAVLSFIVVFGITKVLTNYLAGRPADRFGRKHVLVAGWVVAAPVPFLLVWAPSWSWYAGPMIAVQEEATHKPPPDSGGGPAAG